ncbi:hypothetical protein [Pseudoalteromonas denitrificans]|jgi:hypothetical protein|nr:hypothetical protein [Pseudoalteromonas denitrificans]
MFKNLKKQKINKNKLANKEIPTNNLSHVSGGRDVVISIIIWKT